MIVRIKTQLQACPENVTDVVFPVRVQDIPNNIPTEVNPRTPGHSGPYRAMLEALTTAADTTRAPFVHANSGMFVAASGVRFERQGEVVIAVIDFDPKANGLYNGGHTYLAIQDAKSHKDFQVEEQVRFHVKTGLSKDQILHMVEAANNTKQVKGYSLAYSRGLFDWLEGILLSMGVRQNFKFEEGESAELNVLHILRLLIIANPKFYPTNVKRSELAHGSHRYCQVGSTLRAMENDKDNAIRGMAPNIRFLFNLLTKLFKDADKLHRVHRDRAYVSQSRTLGRDIKIPFSAGGETVKHILHQGVYVPAIAPLRMFLNENMEWTLPQATIMTIYAKALPEILDKASKIIKDYSRVEAAASSEFLWHKFFEIVEEKTQEVTGNTYRQVQREAEE